MKENVTAAVVAAVNAYMEEEVKETPTGVMPTFILSPWKVFGLHELMRRRTSLQKRVQQR